MNMRARAGLETQISLTGLTERIHVRDAGNICREVKRCQTMTDSHIPKSLNPVKGTLASQQRNLNKEVTQFVVCFIKTL